MVAGSKGGERPLQYSVKRKPVLGPPMMDLLWLCQWHLVAWRWGVLCLILQVLMLLLWVGSLRYGRGLGPVVQVQGGQANGAYQCYDEAGAGVHRSVIKYCHTEVHHPKYRHFFCPKLFHNWVWWKSILMQCKELFYNLHNLWVDEWNEETFKWWNE